MQVRNPRYITRLHKIPELSDSDREELRPVTDRFLFKSNEYYLSLIDWNDPDDPIRRIIIPSLDELDSWGVQDPSHESRYTFARGLQHKYRPTALLLVSQSCGGYCRFCFRKRLFSSGNAEVNNDISDALDYIRKHEEISNVLVTGGDPLMLSTKRLEPIIKALRNIEHIGIIRIGSKLPAYNPYRILNDQSLCKMIEKYPYATLSN